MTSEPVIVVLEDERPQVLAIRAALKGLGEVRDFADPDSALSFVKEHAADAAIVDIHMPRHRIDGMEFIRSVRHFDRDLSVIIRTGDDSVELADDAIEVRAFRRAIKGKTSIDELRALTVEALVETRDRRQTSRNAAGTARVKTQLVQTLGTVEDELSVTEGYKAMFQALRNTLTAIAGYSEVLCEAAGNSGDGFLNEQAAAHRTLVGRLLRNLNAFLDSPYAESLRAARSQRIGSANGVIESVRRRFQASPQWTVDGRSLAVLGLSQDMYVSAPPIKLMTALRHLIEFCLTRSPTGSETRLTAHCVEKPIDAIEDVPGPSVVFNRSRLTGSMIYVAFRLRADLVNTSLEDIRRAFHEYPDDPRAGNLQMIGFALGDEAIVVVVQRVTGNATVFELYVPLGR